MNNFKQEKEDLDFMKEGMEKYDYVRSENYF